MVVVAGGATTGASQKAWQAAIQKCGATDYVLWQSRCSRAADMPDIHPFGEGAQELQAKGVVSLLGCIVVELRFSLSWGCGSLGEISSFGLPKRAASDTSLPPWRHRLGGPACGGLLVFLYCQCGGCRGSGPERLCLHSEAAVSGSIAGGGLVR
jgi:hypothetical protein